MTSIIFVVNNRIEKSGSGSGTGMRTSEVMIKKSDLDEIMIKNACFRHVIGKVPHSKLDTLEKHLWHCIKMSKVLTDLTKEN